MDSVSFMKYVNKNFFTSYLLPLPYRNSHRNHKTIRMKVEI